MRGLAVGLDNVKAGNLALEGTGNVGVGAVFEHLARYVLHAAHELGLLEGTIAYHHGLFKHFSIYFEGEVDNRAATDRHLHIGKTDAGANKRGVGCYGQ